MARRPDRVRHGGPHRVMSRETTAPRDRDDSGRGPDVQLGGGRNDCSGPADYVAGLRRRREASWRMPPLACVRRDPLDPPRPLQLSDSASWTAAVEHLAALGHDVRWAVPPHAQLDAA